MHDNHESLLGGHRGENKALTLIRRHFFWPTMKRDIKNYVQSCKKCQESKASTQRKLGKLRPFPPTERKWEEISMDFMFSLPKAKDNKKAILVVVDKLLKRAHFIPLTAEHKAEDTAKCSITRCISITACLVK